jgi:glyoxylase-like metal-dependent hydrolase (beta-lactamase superfamily II)
LEVRRLEVGPLAANCYLVWKGNRGSGIGDRGSDGVQGSGVGDRGPDGRGLPIPPARRSLGEDGDPRSRIPCLVIDPGAEPETIHAALEKENLVPELVVATHCHADHVGAVNALLEAFPEAVFAAGEEEADWPGDPVRNLSYGFGFPMRMANPTRLLSDGEEIEAAGLSFRVISVPGHSPGSVVLYCPEGNAVFTGDTLFALNIGRGDLPGGDGRLLVEGIRERILPLPPETVVWPGHANRTRVGTERKSNPFAGENALFRL